MSVSMSKPETARPAEPGDRNGAIPPLESGDRITRDEFERRYAGMPALTKAELIEGVVYVASPVRQRYHGKQHYHLLTWFGHYEAGTAGVEGGDNSTVRLDLNNEPQPDCVFFVQPEKGGQVHIDDEGYINGRPILSPRSPPAVQAMTCTTSSTPFGALASASTSSAACLTGKSIGLYCAGDNTN